MRLRCLLRSRRSATCWGATESVRAAAGSVRPTAARRPEARSWSRITGVVSRSHNRVHLTFLKGAARIARTRPEVTFVVAGDGELRGGLETQARHLLGDRCRFLGWVMDLRESVRGA